MKKLIIFCLILIFPISTNALTFNPGYIISDTDLTDHQSMDQGEIQSFLEKKSGQLDNYSCKDTNGITKSASEIIYRAALLNKVNPKFLLVMLQKEQSLIEDSTPKQTQYDWAMGYAVCDSCSMDDPKIQKFKGFGNQVDEAAGAQRWYIENAGNGIAKAAGESYTIDDKLITMANQATANLYTFTPHIHGNYNFWKIWHQWFTQSYPDGSLLSPENESGVYLIERGTKRPFMTYGALLSRFNPDLIIEVSKTDLDKYESGSPIKYANYSLLESRMGNKFLLVDDTLRKFESEEVVRAIGYHPEEFELIEMRDYKLFEKGEPITISSIYPAGALLQNDETGAVFFVQEAVKYPVPSKDILLINFSNYTIIPVHPEELEKYELGAIVKPREGSLLMTTDDPAVYVISQGKRWPIISGDVFEKPGYDWNDIKHVIPETLSHVPLGNYIELSY